MFSILAARVETSECVEVVADVVLESSESVSDSTEGMAFC